MHYLECAAIADGEDSKQVHKENGLEHAVLRFSFLLFALAVFFQLNLERLHFVLNHL